MIDPLSGSSGTPATTTQTERKDPMGRDTFLRLLTTQLAHQDPMQPQADGEFIAQLATFSSLEQLTQIQKSLDRIGTALGVPMDDVTGDPTKS